MTRTKMMFMVAVITATVVTGCYDPEETGPRQGPVADAGMVPVSDGGPLPTACELDPQTQDGDGEGYCPAGHDLDGDGTCCDSGEALDPNAGDCNDDPRGAGALFSPGNHEICGNGLDEDCGESPCATPGSCPDPDDADPDCNPAVSECDHDADCATGAFCIVSVRCTDHRCIAGVARDCGDGVDTTADSCDEAGDRCVHTALPPVCTDAGCSDGLFCNGSERCVGGVCVAGTTVSCIDGDARTTDSCSEAADTCNHVTVAGCLADVECSDGLFCNGSERCNAVTGTCQSGTAPSCNDSDARTTDSCNEAADICNHTAIAGCLSAAECSNGLYCDGAERCTGGSCVSGTAPSCNDGIATTSDSCNEAGDTCNHVTTYECLEGALRTCTTSCGGDVGVQVCQADGRWPSACSAPAERCANGRDDDCDGFVDEVCPVVTYYRDSDGDGYGRNDMFVTVPTVGYTVISGDCNDSNAAVHPGASEVCGDTLDNDCNGGELPCAVSVTYYRDADADGYGRNDVTQVSSSGAPSGYVATSGDCNDSNASVHPGAADVCPSNGIDDDCSGGDMTACGASCTMTDFVTVRVGSPGTSAYRTSFNMEDRTCTREYRYVDDSVLPIEKIVESRDGLYMVQVQQTSSGQWFSYMETSTPFSPIFLRSAWGVTIQVNSAACSFPTIPSGGYTPPATIAPTECIPCYDSAGNPNVCINTSSSTRELRCNDGVDNDADGSTDAADLDCGRWS